MPATPSLPVKTPTSQVFEPRERSAVGAAAITAAAILLWGVYLLANAESWLLDGLLLGVAVVASGGAITVICWYAGQKAGSLEHRQLLERQQRLLDEVEELRDDNRRIIAEVQQLSTRLQDHYWRAYSDGVLDSTPPSATGTGASISPLRPRVGR